MTNTFDRRDLLVTAVGGALLTQCSGESERAPQPPKRPVVVSTWEHGLAANEAAWQILEQGGGALDASEAGVRVTEADPSVTTVGIGGLPDRNGRVSLDACIMGPDGDCGSVAGLEETLHPISVARRVMEQTPHVMLVGQGAQDFARSQGFEAVDLLTPEAEAAWREWRATGEEAPVIDAENHDTIGLLALDQRGDLAGACTTSGAKFKLPGRVGDSPLIGPGLYVDNEVGAATATGWGEAVIRAVGSFLVVERMRAGRTAQQACEDAVDRVISKNPDWRSIQVGFIALSTAGDVGGFCIDRGFEFAVRDGERGNVLLPGPSRL